MKCLLCNFTLSDSEDLKEHCIDFPKVDFYNAKKLVNDFLFNVKSRRRRSTEEDFIIKWGFSLENVQSSPCEEMIVNSRYWSTPDYQTK